MRRSNRFVCLGLALASVALCAGCTDSSPAMRAWERSSGMAGAIPENQPRRSAGLMVASDSFGALVLERGPAVANAPTE